MSFLLMLVGMLLWFLYLSNLTFYRFKSKGLSLSGFWMYIFFPYIMFYLHLRLVFKHKYNFKQKMLIILFFIIEYKSIVIFFTEMILEHAAQVEVNGHSKFLSREKMTDKKPVLKDILDWFKQPTSSDTYGKLVFAS